MGFTWFRFLAVLPYLFPLFLPVFHSFFTEVMPSWLCWGPTILPRYVHSYVLVFRQKIMGNSYRHCYWVHRLHSMKSCDYLGITSHGRPYTWLDFTDFLSSFSSPFMILLCVGRGRRHVWDRSESFFCSTEVPKWYKGTDICLPHYHMCQFSRSEVTAMMPPPPSVSGIFMIHILNTIKI